MREEKQALATPPASADNVVQASILRRKHCGSSPEIALQTPPLLPQVGVIAMVPDPWSVLWQPRNHILTRLAKYFHVVWVNPAHKWQDVFTRRSHVVAPRVDCPPGFVVFDSPLWLPKFYRPRRLNNLVLRCRLELARRNLMGRGCEKIVLYIWRPEFGDALTCVAHDLSCYHIDDEYSFSTVETPIPETEARLIAAVSQVFIHSPALLEKKGKINPHTAFVPNGVDYEAHARPVAEPMDLIPIRRPRIGYSGYIKKQLDWPRLITFTALHPEWSFVFVGALSSHPEISPAIQELSCRGNVFFLGSKTVGELAAYPQHFDVCIMPYRQNDYTKYIYPLKLHEYLATGRPTIGTRIRSLLDYSDVVALPSTSNEWTSAIRAALVPEANTEEWRAKRRAVAQRHDWNELVLRIAKAIAQRLGPDYSVHLEQALAASSGKQPR